MSVGSGLFSDQRGVAPYKTQAGKSGLAGEIGDLRQDIERELAPLAAIAVQEFTAPLAASATNMMAATASQVTEDVLLPAASAATGALTQATINNLATGGARQLEFTVGGVTPAQRAPTATIYGTGLDGRSKQQVIPLPDVAADVFSGFFTDVDKIVLAPGAGTGATVSVGLGTALGLNQKIVSRAGRVAVLQEVANGSVVTNGVVAAGAVTAGSDTGTEDISDATVLGNLDATDFSLSVDGAAAVEVTFDAPADEDAVVSQVNAALTAAGQPAVASHVAIAGPAVALVLTSTTTGPSSSIKLIAGDTDALTVLGMTADVYQGADTGNGSYTPNSALNGALNFALYYEFDASVDPVS